MSTMSLPLFWSSNAVRPVCNGTRKGELLHACPYWLTVKEMQDGTARAFWMMSDKDMGLLQHDEFVIASVNEVIAHGAKMIFEVDDLQTMSNLRVLYLAEASSC